MGRRILYNGSVMPASGIGEQSGPV